MRRSELVAGVVLAALTLAACGGGGGQGAPIPPPLPEQAETVVTGLVGPEGLCFDGQGYLYIGSTSGVITRVDPFGGRSVFAETGRNLAGLACGPQDEIFAAAFDTGEVLGISQGGVQRTVTSGLDSPNGLLFDSQQRLLVSASGLGGFPAIALVELDGTFAVLATEIDSPNGMAFGPDGRLYVADTLRSRVMVMDVNEFDEISNIEEYAGGIGLADGLAFDMVGNLYVSGGGEIWLILNDTNRTLVQVTEDDDGNVDGPASLAFGRGRFDVDSLYFANYGYPVLGSGTTVASVYIGSSGFPLY